MAGWRVTEGAPFPPGVWADGKGINAAVWSGAAQAVDLCLFDEEGRERRVRLPGRTGEVFHGHVEGPGLGARYGLRVHGPFDPATGVRCDPAKLLVDPYAVALDGPLALHPAMFSKAAGVDSAPFVPKAVVTTQAGPAKDPLLVPWDRTMIYEAHVRGLTRLHPEVPEAERGTFAALARPAVVAHLKALGVTTLELLPTAAWIDEPHLKRLGLTNYWGYNPIAFAAPDPRLAPGGWAEVRRATQTLAEAGIEVILDVVFNHSGEGDAEGPTLSLRGLDNAGYYRLHPEDHARYIDDSGTGNTLALDRPQGVALVMHALRTWARRGGVSGFRFDLATVLGRRQDGFDPAAPLLSAIDQDPELGRLKMIAEPWDCGPGGHQLGRFPARWGEWNDGFRDGVRLFWRGDPMPLGRMAEALAGSEPALGGHGRPSRGVNFVTAHDGFTLADLVAYETKHNLANGEDNRDGTDHNLSWNNGVEGPASDEAVLARRGADQRALLATLLLSRGTPMLAMGAELGHSQAGNNNAYAQDNPTSWIDWAKADGALLAFARRLVRARAGCPALRHDRFLTGEPTGGYPDVVWLRGDGEPMAAPDWDDPAGATLTCVLTAEDSRAAIVLHRADAAVVRLPAARGGRAWRLIIDTADDSREGPAQETLAVQARSVVLLVEEPQRKPGRSVTDQELAALAERAGVALEWWTLEGVRHVPPPDTQRALLAAMGLAAVTRDDWRASQAQLEEEARRPLRPITLVAEGRGERLSVRAPDGWVHLETEEGETVALPLRGGRCDLPSLPAGRHRLRLDEAETVLLAAPATAFEPDPLVRRAGVAAQLYALRGCGDAGIGDLATLAELAEGAASRGLSLIGLNPLHALFPGDRSRVSPYYPSDRRFLDPIYIDVPGLPGDGATLVDYERVWARKSAVLERDFEAFHSGPGDPAFEAFVAEGGEALRAFCAFQAIAERHPSTPWTAWRKGLDDASGPAVAAFAQGHAERLGYHAYLQWRADRRLAEARVPGIDFLRDLAVGPAPDGAETWSNRSLFARGVSIGAPPDALSPEGQVWGLPPPLPRVWLDQGLESFAALLRANMRHAGALRIDHALGLARLFWVPEGAAGEDGTYVRYPMDELLAVIALESRRARCLVVAEDLGTAPEGLRPALHAKGVYGYKVLPLERDGPAYRPPDAYPQRALACVATHDLPTLEGWWKGADLDERAALGLLAPDDASAARAARQDERRNLLQAMAEAGMAAPDTENLSDETAAAIHASVAAAPSLLFLAQAEDLAGEVLAVNLPGTHLERPNWRRRLSMSLSELWSGPRCQAILGAIQNRGG